MADVSDWLTVLPLLLEDRWFGDELLSQLRARSKSGRADLEECIEAAFDECAEEVLQFSWGGETPLCSTGSSWLRAVGTVHVCTSTDWAKSGPYLTWQDAVAHADTFNTESTNPELQSSSLSDDELARIGAQVCSPGCDLYINGELYRGRKRKTDQAKSEEKA